MFPPRSSSIVAAPFAATLLLASAALSQQAPPATGTKPTAPGEGAPPILQRGQQAPPRQRPGPTTGTVPNDPSLTTTSQRPINVAANPQTGAPDDALDTAPVIRFEPEELDFGEMEVEVAETGKVRIVNISDKPITISRAIPSCGCTTPVWPKDPIAPGESAEMEVTLKPGSRAGVPLHKTVTLQIDGHAPVRLSVKGQIPEYIRFNPSMIEAPGTSGRAVQDTVTFTSVDGTPFRLTGITPAIAFQDDMAKASETAATEHKVRIDWQKWAEAGRVFRAQFTSDHPKAKVLNVMIRRPVERAAERPELNPSQQRQAPSALVFAAQRGDLAEVQRLLASGEDVNQVDPSSMRTALHWAAKNNNLELMDALLKAGAMIEATDRTGRGPLAIAAESGNIEAIHRLIEAHADVNARDQLSGTPILWAAGLGSPEAVQALLDAGADPNIADGNGMTPLIWAANLGDGRNVEVLLNSGRINLEATDLLTGDTALMRACRNGKLESVQALIAKGARLDVRNRQGMTPFLLAAQSGTLDKLKALVAAKADVTAEDSRGWNAVAHARSRSDAQREEILAYLITELRIPDKSATDGTGRPAAAAGEGASRGG